MCIINLTILVVVSQSAQKRFITTKQEWGREEKVACGDELKDFQSYCLNSWWCCTHTFSELGMLLALLNRAPFSNK